MEPNTAKQREVEKMEKIWGRDTVTESCHILLISNTALLHNNGWSMALGISLYLVTAVNFLYYLQKTIF